MNRERPGQRWLPQIPQGTAYDPQALLGADLYQRGGGRVMAEMARVGQFGDYALEQQAIVDATRRKMATPLGGLPTGSPPQAGTAMGSVLPPGFSDPLTGAFKLPDGQRAQLRRMGADPDLIESTVNRNLLERTHSDYQTRLLYGQQAAKSPDELQAAKEELFSKTARALAADPGNRDRILEATFSGPNADQLLGEFDARMAKENAEGGFLDDLVGSAKNIGQGAITSFGQMMSGLQGPADVLRGSIGVLLGARKESGETLTAADVGREVKQLPTDIFNVLSLGTAGLTDKRFRSGSAIPNTNRIAQTMRTRGVGDEIGMLLVPFLGPTRFAQQVGGGTNLVSSTFGFLGDVTSDPTTYLTLGAGGLGSGATKLAGNVASRAKFLNHLGLDEMIPKFATADEMSWRQFQDELVETVGPQAMAEANDVAKVFKVSAENAHGAQGWAGYRSLLAEQGLDADALVPRGFVGVGLEAKQASRLQAARGGVGLRGGLGVGKYQVRGSLNLAEGGGSFRGAMRPLGSWFTREGNRYHQLASSTLDNVADVFNYGSGADRAWVHQNRGTFNATMEAATKGQGVQHYFNELDKRAGRVGDNISKWLGAEPENATRFIDVIEKGERSDYWSLVPAKIRDQAEELWRIKDEGAAYAAGKGTDIPMLREIADDNNQMIRHFPHKVISQIGERVGFPVTPAKVGAAKARTVRAGTQITGPQGTSQMLTEGSYAEIQDVTQRILGEGILQTDPVKTVRAYLGSVGQAAALKTVYDDLTSAGLLVPDVSDLAPGVVRGAGDPVRGIWAKPGERAERAVAEAQAAVGKTSAEAAKVMRERAIGHTRQAELEAELAMYASRQADADSKIHAMKKDTVERAEMLAMAKRDHAVSVREARTMHQATRRAMVASARTDLKGVKDAKAILARQLKSLDARHAEAMAEFDAGLAAQTEVLQATPEAVGRALKADLAKLGAESVGGARPYNQVLGELRATRHRLAQVEGGQIAAGQDKRLIGRAKGSVTAKREQVLIGQRKAGAEAADLTEAIGEAERAVAAAVKAGDDALEVTTRGQLTELMARRTEVLQQAERATAEAAELWDLVDAGEAGMRMADLREAEVLAHQAGSVIDTQTGRMGPSLQAKMSRLLQVHAAELVAEQSRLLAMSPRLKFLNRAMRDFSVIDTSLPAIPTVGTGRALADYAQEFLARVEQRGGEMRAGWDAAVGDPTKAYTAAREEYKIQMSALLAKELDLTSQVEAARGLEPSAQVLSQHQVQGDQLNLFTAELHKGERELEWWMTNRDDVRKTQTLKALQLGAIMRENDELGRAVGAAQRLADKDQHAASIALTKAMSDRRIFDLMAPEIEHLSAVVGKLPFMEGGAAMPREVASVVERVMNRGPESHGNFMKVMNSFNTRWKRTILATTGSVFRRWVGNVYNATVLAGVNPASFAKAFDAMGARGAAKTLDKIKDPKLRYYMELADEYNIFEGQFASLASDTQPLQGGTRHPLQWAQQGLQTAALRGEDIARLAQFIHGLDSGMGPQAARMWTGKYHFFNNELTQAERTVLRPLYPFYAYLRNNYALQFYTLFHQPGKISLYGHAMRDFSATARWLDRPRVGRGGGRLPDHRRHLAAEHAARHLAVGAAPERARHRQPRGGLGLEPDRSVPRPGRGLGQPAHPGGGRAGYRGGPDHGRADAPPGSGALGQAHHLGPPGSGAGQRRPEVEPPSPGRPAVPGPRRDAHRAAARGRGHLSPGAPGPHLLDQPAPGPWGPDPDSPAGGGSLRRAGRGHR